VKKRPFVIAVAGGSGSGKTTVTEKLMEQLGERHAVRLSHDNYYRNQDHLPMSERVKTNYDHPQALETMLLVKHLDQLLSGKSVHIPTYDFANHTRAKETIELQPYPVVVVDGILLYESTELRQRFDLKLFVDTDADVRLARRLRRDVAERGRTYEFSLDQYLEFTRPMHIEFVEPTRRYADIIIPEGGFNTVALDVILAKVRELVADAAEQKTA
jgi:uridine kinase